MYLSWKSDSRDYICIDVEADRLNATKIWCMCWKNLKTNDRGSFLAYEKIKGFLGDHMARGSLFVGHNILKYDLPTLNRIVGSRVPASRCVDTLVLSTLYSPSLAGGHSLAAWGKRLKLPKGEFNDFSRYTPEMLVYCEQDVNITGELFIRITGVLGRIGFTEKAIDIQHRITSILREQEKNGFYFDNERALGLYADIKQREERLRGHIYHAFPPLLTPIASYGSSYKRDGTRTANYERHALQFPRIEDRADGSYTVFDYVDFNLGSPKQRIEKLLDLGWKPQEFTKTGLPQPFQKGQLSPSLEQFLEEMDVPEVKMIAKWMMFSSISGMINTWMDNFNDQTHCIHGSIFVADTLRFRHQKPNTANIPAVRMGKTGLVVRGEDGYFTYESRDLWTARPGRTLVGTDAAGLELRMLAHYLNNPEFTEQVVNGSPHDYNAAKLGVDKPKAKTFIYAFLYGAGDKKIGSIVGGGTKAGKLLKQTFTREVEGLSNVIKMCEREFRAGRISLVDGSQIICPSNHAALNYKLQGGGARLMAQGAIFLEQHIRRSGLSSLKVGDIHDEWQYDCDPNEADEHSRLAVQSLQEAGEELNLRVPITGTSKKGLTWAETH